jgi:hypothetical protein
MQKEIMLPISIGDTIYHPDYSMIKEGSITVIMIDASYNFLFKWQYANHESKWIKLEAIGKYMVAPYGYIYLDKDEATNKFNYQQEELKELQNIKYTMWR